MLGSKRTLSQLHCDIFGAQCRTFLTMAVCAVQGAGIGMASVAVQAMACDLGFQCRARETST